MNFLIGLLILIVITVFSIVFKALTNNGLITMWLIGIFVLYFGNLHSLFIIVIFYIIAILGGKIKKRERKKLKNVHKKIEKRDAFQVLANSLLGTIALIIYYFTKDYTYLLAFSCTMASSLADSLASDIGVLSKRKPIDILTFKKSKPGMSGAVSVLGLVASLLGAFLIALSFNLIFIFSYYHLITITVIGFLGGISDSILGSLIQIKYQCTICGELTEKKTHCDKKTKIVGGMEVIDNNIVNFLNNFVALILAIIIF